MDIEVGQPTKLSFRDGLVEKYRENSKKTSLRKLHLVIDFSQVMLDKDFNPNIIYMVLTKAIEFVTEFFELNPLSNIALSMMKDRKCNLLCDFENNPNELVRILDNLRKKNSISEDKFFEDLNKDSDTNVATTDIPSGTISMENTLKATCELMADQPLFYVRELLVLLGSSNSRDSYDIYEAVDKINSCYIVVNMISVSSLPFVFQQICIKSKGKFEVALNEHDFRTKLMVGRKSNLRITHPQWREFQRKS